MASVAIVPAAGKGERFGGAKLLALLRGEPLLNHTLRCLLDGGVDRVVVVGPPDSAFHGVALLADARVTVVVNPNPSRGMFSSIQVGAAAADGDPMLVLPGDMPFVRASTVAAVLTEARRTGDAVSPAYAGRRGHPLALSAALRDAVRNADGGTNLAEVLEQHASRRRIIEVDDPGVLRDVDVAGDLHL